MADWQGRLRVTGFVLLLGSIYFLVTSEGLSISVLVSLLLLLLGLSALHASYLNPAPGLSFSALFTTYLLNRLVVPSFARKAHKKTWESMKHPQKHQDEVLMKILAENGQTEFGKDHKLSKIKSRQEFRKTFPLTKFDTYEKYVERIAMGERNVMTKAEVIQLCASSGTTGKNKLYPITNADLHLFRQFGLTYMHVFYKVHEFKINQELDFRLFHPVTKTAGGLRISGASAARQYVKGCNTSPAVLSRILKEGPSYFVQALFGLRESHIDFIQGMSSDLMHAFFRSMEFNKDALVKAIATAHIDPFPGLEDDIRQELNQMLTPDPERARKVRQELERGSDAFASRVWPLLNIVMVGRTGAYAHSANLLENSYLKHVTLVFGIHGATEGSCGCSMTQHDLHREVYTFVPSLAFFEFIKVEEMDQSHPKTFLLNELEVGQLYEVVITNWHGLYRNRFGDVIKVVGYTENTPSYTFQYRTGQILNCAYDQTPEQVFYEALKMAEAKWGIVITSYTSTESMHLEAINGEKYRKNHYVAFIETAEEVKLNESDSAVLEKKLCEKHETYAVYREQDSVGPIHIIQVRRGTFDGLRSVIWDEKPNVQYKTPRVLRTPKALSYLWNNRIENK